MKLSQNTDLDQIDRLTYPATSTMIDRYILANHWTKGKKVLDAATGKGYGAGILLSLGAKSVIGIDIDKDGVNAANENMQSNACQFLISDIFNLRAKFSENEFDVCTSIETFEHLPPERINDYLQELKVVTKDTIVITTPRRKSKEWTYQGGTHLYEYDVIEFRSILEKNFPGSFVDIVGLNEVRLPNGQWGTDISIDLDQCWVFFAVIHLQSGNKKQEPIGNLLDIKKKPFWKLFN